MPKLQYRFNSETKDILLYDTPPNDKSIAIKIDRKTYYAGLLPVGHSRASNLRICRDGEIYAVSKEGGDKVALEDYSWSEIATVIKSGNASEYFAVGDTRPITISSINNDQRNMAGTYRVQILGIDHNAEIEGYNRVHFAIGRDVDDTIDISFLGKCPNTSETHSTDYGVPSNEGGWEGSDLRSWLNNDFYNALPSDLRNVITACTKYTDNVGLSTGTEDAVTATSDKIWIPAAFEVFGYVVSDIFDSVAANSYEENKQAQYDYYKNGNNPVRVYSHDLRTKDAWWLRSPLVDKSSQYGKRMFCAVCGGDPEYAGKLGAFSTDTNNGLPFVPCFTIS